jgi:hypothetical protein
MVLRRGRGGSEAFVTAGKGARLLYCIQSVQFTFGIGIEKAHLVLVLVLVRAYYDNRRMGRVSGRRITVEFHDERG